MIGVCYVWLTILFLFVAVVIVLCALHQDEITLSEDESEIIRRMIDRGEG